MTTENDTTCTLVSSWSKCGTVWSGGHCFHLWASNGDETPLTNFLHVRGS